MGLASGDRSYEKTVNNILVEPTGLARPQPAHLALAARGLPWLQLEVSQEVSGGGGLLKISLQICFVSHPSWSLKPLRTGSEL